jgi:hypothetical protein
MKNYMDTDGAFLVRSREQADSFALSVVRDFEARLRLAVKF